MFGLKRKGPDRPFSHSDSCPIVAADPSVEILWSEMERGHWVATCACGEEHVHMPAAPRTRLDPLDPATAHHLPQCDLAASTDAGVLRLALKVVPKDNYAWVTCGVCDGSWQVPTYAVAKEA